MLSMIWRCLLIAALPLIASSDLWAQQESAIRLTDVTSTTGIDFVHTDGSDGRFFFIESMSAGLALLDFDGDGDQDIYFLNGAPVQPAADDIPVYNALYRNDGDWKFTNVTSPAAVGDTRLGLGVAAADYDNDGFVDLYLNNYGRNVLYHNCGDGTYQELTQQAAVGNGQRVGGGVSFFDMDADGDLDLYVGNYIHFDPINHRMHVHRGLPSYPSPLSFEPDVDTLYENQGDGTFRDVSEAAGITAVAGRSMGLATFDYDTDGDTDVFVANDTQANFLFANDGQGQFEEVALFAGLAYDFKGNSQASMGVEVVDLDQDGRLDLYMTSFSEEFATFYRNLGEGLFDDASLKIGASRSTFPHVTWGVVAADWDNNTTPDLMIATGHLDPLYSQRGGVSSTTNYRVRNLVLSNQGSGHMVDLGSAWGSGGEATESTRGLVAGDLNNDGRQDAVALNSRRPPTVMRNESAAAHFVQLKLVGTTSNRDGLGAMVRIEQDGTEQTSLLYSGHSYQSESPHIIHFGLGNSSAIVRVEVDWPSGLSTQFDMQPSQLEVLVESFTGH